MLNGLTYNLESSSYIMHSCVTLDDIFSLEELEIIEINCGASLLQKAQVNNGMLKEDFRKSNVSYIYADDQTKWVFDKLQKAVETINKNTYRFDLTGFEYFQYTEYDGAGSKYDWHMDMKFDATLDKNNLARKLSFSLVLSDNSEYQGGEFEIFTKNLDEGVRIEQKRNRLIAFPSFVYHRVAPILKGKRRTIVFWVLGPKFK